MEFSETYIYNVKRELKRLRMFSDISETLSELFSSSSGETEEGMDLLPLFIGIGAALLFVFLVFLAVTIIKNFWNKYLFKLHKKAFIQKINKMECFSSDLPEAALHSFALRCWETGLAIDAHTDRSNNVNLVSDLVYRMCRELKMEKLDCALNFCAAMIYDIGFLDIPGYIFMTEILTQDERNIVKTHVMRFQDRIDFIPEQWQVFFTQVVMYHHENINGTGYPGGYSADEIPVAARMLRIAESYVSLTTSRAYHRAKTSRSALVELKSSPFYDQNLVSVLEKVVSVKNSEL